MRKHLKIKAFTFLFAWGMIFAHSVIPHNHCDDCITQCNESLHKTCSQNDEQGNLPEFLSHPDDVSVCHLSGFVYHQFDQDNLISFYPDNSIIIPITGVGIRKWQGPEDHETDHHNESASLRAPPSA